MVYHVSCSIMFDVASQMDHPVASYRLKSSVGGVDLINFVFVTYVKQINARSKKHPVEPQKL